MADSRAGDANRERDMTGPGEKMVLVALDGSREATRAVPVARAVASQLHARLAALHVAREPIPAELARPAAGLDTPELSDIPILVRAGRPAEVIVREAEQPEVELLVLTTLAGGDPDRELGSVARQVAINTTHPILTMRPEIGADPASRASPLVRLVVPLDGARATASALRPVTRLARRLGASVDVVYVVTTGDGQGGRGSMPAPRYVDQAQHEWKQWTQELADRLMVDCAGFSPDVHIGVSVREGEPGAEIVRFAREGRYDAIVLVRRSRLEPERAQTLRTVIRDSTCPLLMVGGEE